MPPMQPGFRIVRPVVLPAPPAFAATCEGRPLPPESGGTVKGLQTYLNRIGFGPLKVDGVCGFLTFDAWQKWNAARTRAGWLETTPSTPPSGPYPPKKRVEALPTPPVPVPPPVKPPIWKRPSFYVAAGAVVLLIYFMRRRRRS